MAGTLEYILDSWRHYLETRASQEYVTLYVHLPFCTSRCKYCIYPSVPHVSSAAVDDYLAALTSEMSVFSPLFAGTKIEALYIGGGTPSLLTVSQMNRLFDSIRAQFELDVCNDHMFAFEVAPHHIDTDKVDVIASSFINRVSMGVQTFDRDVQRAENRPNPSSEYITFILGYLMASLRAKLSRVNVDLMIGLDGQTTDSVQQDLEILTGIGVPCITLYANRKQRAEAEHIRFERYVVSSLSRLEPRFPSYDLITNPEGYSVASWFLRQSYNHFFTRVYRTRPHLNSTLGFGYQADSFITPQQLWYHRKGNGYLIDHDPARGISRSDTFRSMFAEGRRLLADQVDVCSYEL